MLEALGNVLPTTNPLYLIPVAVVLVHVVPYLVDVHNAKHYPGPFLAKFSDAWLGWVSKQGHRSEVVHQLHQKYGTSSPFSSPISDSC
jgi:benzoate 4-monooxygenase